MFDKDQPKLKLDKAKLSLTNFQTAKTKTKSSLEPKHQKAASSTLHKHLGSKIQNSPTSKNTKSKAKLDNTLSLGKSLQKTQKKERRQRLVSQLVPKQADIRHARSLQKNDMKYIFNSMPRKHKVQFSSQALKPRNSTLFSHSKCHSNLTLAKNSYHMKNDAISSFGKTTTSDFSKVKKKKHDYIKKINKTSNFERSISSGFQTIDFIHPSSIPEKTFDRMASIQSACGLEKQSIGFEVTDEDLENVRMDAVSPKLSEIRHNVSSLFKKLKSPSKLKLLLISNNYEKIVSDLFLAIKNPILPNCEISRINTNHSEDQEDHEKENQKPFQNDNEKVQQQYESPLKQFRKPSELENPYNIRQVTDEIESSNETSEHWDSYMNLNSQEIRSMNKIKNESNSKEKVKKLNLHAIKKPEIKQYQDEFMDMKDTFSESWKRQLSQQARY